MDWRKNWWVGCLMTWVGAMACDAPRVPGEAGLAPEIERAIEVLCEQNVQCACHDAVAVERCQSDATELWRTRVQVARELGLTYDPACAEFIAEAANASQCAWPGSTDHHPCEQFCAPFYGERALGESCTASDGVSDCVQGLTCSGGHCSAPCEVLSGLPRQGLCRDPDTGVDLDRCALGLVCSSTTSRCIDPAQDGESCQDVACGPGLWCDWRQDGRCRPARGPDEACDRWDGECESGLVCSYSEATGDARCQAPGVEGQSCRNVGCTVGLTCDHQDICRTAGQVGDDCQTRPCDPALDCHPDTRRCELPPGAGEPCPFGRCSDAWCDLSNPDGAQCRARMPQGERCSGHAQCASGYCPAGHCTPRPELGEDCSRLFVCAPGLSCDGQQCRESMAAGPAVCVYDGW